MPIAKAEIIPGLLSECPQLQAVWDKHAADWAKEDPRDYDGEIPGDYNNASAMIHALIEFYTRGQTDCFPRFFGYIERLINEGDAEVQNIAVVGYLETLQTAASWKDHGPEVFVQWMGPESRRSWAGIHQWWSGGKSLMDIAIDEAQKGKEET
jgi:hypothetical protein